MKKEIDYFNPRIKVLSHNYNHLINRFDSGEFAFNHFISKLSFKDKDSGGGVTYVVINEEPNEESDLVAYYTISTGTLNIVNRFDFEDDEISEEEKREYYLPISSFIINMFAVDKKYQDCYFEDILISSMILKNVISELYNMSVSLIGAKRIILCSVPKAVRFYKRNEFEILPKEYTILDKADVLDNIPMYLTLHDVHE